MQDSLLISGLKDSGEAGFWENSLEKGRTDLRSRELGKGQGLGGLLQSRECGRSGLGVVDVPTCG